MDLDHCKIGMAPPTFSYDIRNNSNGFVASTLFLALSTNACNAYVASVFTLLESNKSHFKFSQTTATGSRDCVVEGASHTAMNYKCTQLRQSI
jgi:hypothetical protein